MKRVIIIVLILLVVAGGGAGGLIMLGIVHNPFRQAPKSADVAAQEAAAADAKARAANLPTENLKMVKDLDFAVPVVSGDQSERRVFVNIRLWVTKGDVKAVKNSLAERQFQDAVLSDLIPYFQDFFRDHDLIDVEVLKSKLQKHSDDVFGDGACEVLLVNVFESGGPVTDPTRSSGSDE